MRLKARFFRFCRPGGLVLDLGCGTGFNQRFLDRGTRYVGIDPLRLASRYAFPFAQAMGEFLPLRSGFFDSVICIATLDHVADPEMIVRECHRILRPGGTLGIVSKVVFEGTGVERWGLYARVGLRKLVHGNIGGLLRGFREAMTGAEDEFHMHHFTRESLRALCARYFEDLATETVGNVLFLRGRGRERTGLGAAAAGREAP